MKHIGNILTESKFDDVELFNVVKDAESLEQGIPTLMIGWEKYAKNCPNVSILDWRIDDLNYWTFGKRERRSQMERDIERFKKTAMSRLTKAVKYSFFNVLTEPKEDKKSFFESMKDNGEKTMYVTNDMIYLYYKGNNEIKGVSLRDIEYGGGNKKRVFATLYGNPSVKDVKDAPYEIRNALKNNLYIMPYLFSQ